MRYAHNETKCMVTPQIGDKIRTNLFQDREYGALDHVTNRIQLKASLSDSGE